MMRIFSHIWYKNGSYIPFLLATVLLAILIGCSFDKPVAPKWDVRLAVPLMNRTFTMQELIEKNDFLVSNAQGVVSIDYEDSLGRFEVGDALQVDGFSQSIQSEIGKFTIPSPGNKFVRLTFGQIYPGAYALDGQTVPVPAFQYDNISTTVPPFENFESVLIESGTIQVTITNHLPVPLSAGLRLDVQSTQTGQTLFAFVFDQPISPGASASRTVNLYGVRIPSGLTISMSGGSPGSNGQPVTINASTDGIDIETFISDIVAVEARAAIEPQQFSGKDSVALGDSILITEAVIASGIFRFDFNNQIPLDLNLNLVLDDFLDPAGLPVQLQIPLRSGETTTRLFNLQGYRFRPTVQNGQMTMRYNWTVDVLGSNGEIITLSSQDAVGLDIQVSDLTFSEIRGVLNGVHVPIDTVVQDIDIPEDLDSLRFEAGRLEIIIHNGIGFPIQPELHVLGVNEQKGLQVEMVVQEQIRPASNYPSISKIILDEQNSNLIELLNIMPTKIYVWGQAVVGDGTSESVIRSTDYMDAKVRILAPVALQFPSQTIETDVDTLDIDAGVRSELESNVLEGRFFARLRNHLPFGVEVTFYFSSQDTNVFANPELTIGPVRLDPGEVSAEGKVLQEKVSDINVQLSQEEIRFFTHPTVLAGIKIHIPGSGQIVRVYETDYIHVKAACEFMYHVDPENQSN